MVYLMSEARFYSQSISKFCSSPRNLMFSSVAFFSENSFSAFNICEVELGGKEINNSAIPISDRTYK